MVPNVLDIRTVTMVDAFIPYAVENIQFLEEDGVITTTTVTADIARDCPGSVHTFRIKRENGAEETLIVPAMFVPSTKDVAPCRNIRGTSSLSVLNATKIPNAKVSIVKGKPTRPRRSVSTCTRSVLSTAYLILQRKKFRS
jgi:hypothetical protein